MAATMAIIDNQLLIAPPFRQSFTDGLTLLPLVGKATFFKTDKVTLKNVFIQTGNPGTPFEVSPNPVDLETDGGLPTTIYLYPFDESDNKTIELYYIEFRRSSDNSLVFAIDNFPENFANSTPSDVTTGTVNLAPSFGFDYPFYPQEFTPTTELSAPLENTHPALGFAWFKDNPSGADFFYEFIQNTVGTIDGNPLNLMTLQVANLAGVQTTHWLGFEIVRANVLENEIFTFTIYIQDASAIPVTSIPVSILSSSDKETLTNVGNFTISTALEKQTLIFTMPAVTDTNTENDFASPVQIVMQLPLSQEIKINFTGVYLYEGDEITDVLPPFQQFGISNAEQYFNIIGTQLSGQNAPTSGGENLPITQTQGGLEVQNRTGIVFEGSAGQTFNFAVPLDGTTVVKDELFDNLTDTTIVSTNRYFAQAGTLIQAAGNTFEISNLVTDSFDIGTVDPAVSYTTWVSNTSAITITPDSTPQDLPLTGSISPSTPTKVDFLWNDMFTAEADRDQTALTNFVFSAQSGVFGVWYGESIVGATGSVWIDDNSLFDVLTANAGDSSNQAAGSIEFLTSNTPKSQVIPVPGAGTLYAQFFQFSGDSAGKTSDDNFTWPSEYVFQFHIDSQGDNIPSTKKTVTINLDSNDLSPTTVANALLAAVGAGDIYNLMTNNLPTNGDNIQISTSNRTIDVIFFDTEETKPTKLSSDNATVFVEFTTADSVQTFTTNFSNTLANDIGGIPIPDDLSLAGLASSLQYYVEI